MASTVIRPGDMARPGGDPPVLLCPSRGSIFADRARRFAELAADPSLAALSAWLDFLGRLTAAQDAALQSFPAVPLPAAEALELAGRHGMPPLAAAG